MRTIITGIVENIESINVDNKLSLIFWTFKKSSYRWNVNYTQSLFVKKKKSLNDWLSNKVHIWVTYQYFNTDIFKYLSYSSLVSVKVYC